MEEVWKDIEGYEGLYLLSNTGKVKSLAKTWVSGGGRKIDHKGETFMKMFVVRKYVQVALRNNNITKHIKVHRLVATAFIPNPDNKPQVNHIDGDKNNNRVENLEWCTCSENHIHAFSTGLRLPQASGFGHHSSKIVLNLSTGIFYPSITEAAIAYNINGCTLYAYLTGRLKNKTELIIV